MIHIITDAFTRHRFSGTVAWLETTQALPKEVAGFVIKGEQTALESKKDLILNKLWDILYENRGRDVSITVEVKK